VLLCPLISPAGSQTGCLLLPLLITYFFNDVINNNTCSRMRNYIMYIDLIATLSASSKLNFGREGERRRQRLICASMRLDMEK
jgi:hypothetical protein